jgi:hypothetical protein
MCICRSRKFFIREFVSVVSRKRVNYVFVPVRRNNLCDSSKFVGFVVKSSSGLPLYPLIPDLVGNSYSVLCVNRKIKLLAQSRI